VGLPATIERPCDRSMTGPACADRAAPAGVGVIRTTDGGERLARASRPLCRGQRM